MRIRKRGKKGEKKNKIKKKNRKPQKRVLYNLDFQGVPDAAKADTSEGRQRSEKGHDDKGKK